MVKNASCKVLGFYLGIVAVVTLLSPQLCFQVQSTVK